MDHYVKVKPDMCFLQDPVSNATIIKQEHY